MNEIDEKVDKMYSEMLKRCSFDNCAEMMSGDTFDEDHVNPLEDTEMTSEFNSEQSGIGQGIKFERLRRVTGYLVGDYVSRFNDAKRAEVEDREKHNV